VALREKKKGTGNISAAFLQEKREGLLEESVERGEQKKDET